MRDVLETDGVLVLGDDEVEDLAAAAYLALQANRALTHREQVEELVGFVRGLRAPLEQLQLDLSDRLRLRTDDFEATRALRVVNDALARTRQLLPSAQPNRRRWWR